MTAETEYVFGKFVFLSKTIDYEIKRTTRK